jgi:hypothetical protein
MFVPIFAGPVPELQFHPDDQRAFGESLRRELVRLKLVRSAVTAEAGISPDITVSLLFAQTVHNNMLQIYILDVVMELQGGPKPFLKQYRVASSEKDSELAKMNTTAYEAKAKAAKLLLEKLIPDIEAYVATVQKKPVGSSSEVNQR